MFVSTSSLYLLPFHFLVLEKECPHWHGKGNERCLKGSWLNTKGRHCQFRIQCGGSLVTGTTGDDEKPEMPARAAVLQRGQVTQLALSMVRQFQKV